MCDQGRWDLGYIWLAIVPQVAIELMEAAVSGEWAVQPRQAAMETAIFRASVNHRVTPERRGGAKKKKTLLSLLTGRKAGGCRLAAVPVFTSASQAAMVTGLAVDAAGLAPCGGSMAVVGLYRIIEAVHHSQVG